MTAPPPAGDWPPGCCARFVAPASTPTAPAAIIWPDGHGYYFLHGCEFDKRLYFQVINHDLLGPLAWLDNLPPAGRPRGVVAGRIIISSVRRKEQQP